MTTHILAEPIELLEGTLDPVARTVEVVLIRPGWSRNGRYYSAEVLAAAAALFEGVKAYANHPTREQLRRGEGRSVLDITGDYTGITLGEGGELRATRHVYGQAGEALWPLIERAVQTQRPVIGVSINALGHAHQGTAPDGQQGLIVDSIEAVNSADDVDDPAAGGGFERLLMGGDSLTRDLLRTLTYDEYIEARPDVVNALKKQMKRARQTDEIRALTEERDALATARAETDAQIARLTDQLAAARAEIVAANGDHARLVQEVLLERELRRAQFPHEFEHLLRQHLFEQVDPANWLDVIAVERAKLQAAGVTRVAVHGLPPRESTPIEAHPAGEGPIDMTVFNTADKLVAELQRRAKHTQAR